MWPTTSQVRSKTSVRVINDHDQMRYVNPELNHMTKNAYRIIKVDYLINMIDLNKIILVKFPLA